MNLDDLRLEHALDLLQQAGWSLPEREALADPVFLQSLLDGLCELSLRDALTGLSNRRAFDALLPQELDRVARSGDPAMLLSVDIDHFKRVNDEFGHAAGDEVIRAVGQAIQAAVRPMDTVARVGGEEFAVVLPHCAPTFGAVVAERIRSSVEQMEVYTHGRCLRVTVSGGGAFAPPWVRSSATAWQERADLQLYRAKREGRNRMCLESVPSGDVSAEEKGLLTAWSVPDGLMIDSIASH